MDVNSNKLPDLPGKYPSQEPTEKKEVPPNPEDKYSTLNPLAKNPARTEQVRKTLKSRVKRATGEKDKATMAKLGKELAGATDKRNLGLIRDSQMQAVSRPDSTQTHIHMERVVQSQNPVTKLEVPTIMLRQELSQLIRQGTPFDPGKVMTIIAKMYQSEPNQRNKMDIGRVGTEIKSVLSQAGTPEEKMSQTLKLLNKAMRDDIEDWVQMGSKADTAPVEHWKTLIAQLEGMNKAPSLETVPVQYNRDAVLSLLQVLQARYEGTEKGDQLAAAIRFVKQSPGLYIDKNRLTNLPGIDHTFLQKHLKEYVSSTDFLLKNPGLENAKNVIALYKQRLPDKFDYDKPSYGFKTGMENKRELIAGETLRMMGLNRFLIQKTAVDLPAGELNLQKGVSGIAGPWLESGKPVALDLWSKIVTLQQKIAEAQFKGKPTEELQAKLNKQVAEFEALGGKQSVEELVMGDLLICANDSHLGQLLVVNNEFFNIDVARLLAPSYAVVTADRTYPMMRIALLDHPSMNKPVSPALRENILALDVNQIESELKALGRLPDEAFFNHLNQQIQERKFDEEQLLRPSEQEELKSLHESLSLALLSKLSKEELRRDLEKHFANPAVGNANDRALLESHDDFKTLRALYKSAIIDSAGKLPLEEMRQRTLSVSNQLKAVLEQDLQAVNSAKDAEALEEMGEKWGIEFKSGTPVNQMQETLKQFFADKIQTIHTQLDAVKPRDEAALLVGLYRKYNLPFNPSKSRAELISDLRDHFSHENQKTVEAGYDKIYPQAFLQMKQRILAVQEYFRKEPNATMQGAFAVMYPRLVPFMRVLARMEQNPADTIGRGRDFADQEKAQGYVVGGVESNRSLEGIIVQAKKLGRIKPEEVQELEEALAAIRKESASASMVRFTMGLNL